MTSNVQRPSLALASPSALVAPRPRCRRSVLAAVFGWRWLESKRELSPKESSHAGKETATHLTLARARRMKRSARALLIWGLLFYAVLQLIPILYLERSTEWPWHGVETAIELRKWPKLRQLVAEDPDRPLLLMLGSSRTYWAFRAGDLDGMPDSDGRPLRVYNFGIPATGPIYALLYLRDLLAEGIRPRFLLIEFNPMVLAATRRPGLNEEGMMAVECIPARRLLQWLPYFHRPGKQVCHWLAARIAPWSTFRYHIAFELKCLTGKLSRPTYEAVDDGGWRIPVWKGWLASERWSRLLQHWVGYYPVLSNYQLDNKPIQALHELLDLCRREKIRSALVVMPESSFLRSWYSDNGKKTIHGLLDELSRTYGVAIVDANRWLADDDFEDSLHALPHGAEVFTSRLRAELPRLLAQSNDAKSN